MTFDGHGVVVVDPAQVRKPQMSGKRGRLARHAFHHVAIAADRVDIEIEYCGVRQVVARREPARRDRHPDAVAAALTERAGRGFHAGGAAVFRMAGRHAVELAKILDVIEVDRGVIGHAAAFDAAHAGEMQKGIEQHRGVAGGQDKAIAVRPQRIGRVIAQELLPQGTGDRRQAHWRTRVARVRLFDRVHRQGADGVDATLVEVALAGGATGILLGSGSLGAHWDLIGTS